MWICDGAGREPRRLFVNTGTLPRELCGKEVGGEWGAERVCIYVTESSVRYNNA